MPYQNIHWSSAMPHTYAGFVPASAEITARRYQSGIAKDPETKFRIAK
jgi:hypothetical protein